jgi:hypothetical protein
MDSQTGRFQALPASPPPEAIGAVEAAWERPAELAAQDLALHFGRDEASGRPTVELRSLSGELITELSPSQALEIIAGQAPGTITPA